MTTEAPNPAITVTSTDLERLELLLQSQDASFESLDAELARAQVVPQTEVPNDVVTMNSQVVYEELASGVRRTVTLVYPQDADAEQGRVSILAPLGSALLGLRVGQTIDWVMPSGVRHLRVLAVPYQPEANGQYE